MSKLIKRLIAAFTLISLELLILIGVAFVCVVVFLILAKSVFVDHDQGFDRAAFEFARSHTSPGMSAFLKFVTFFASSEFLIYGSLGLAAIFLFFKKHRWYSLKIPVVAAGSTLLNQGMKFAFDRARPDSAWFEQSGMSFPSGHAMIGGAFYGLLIYLVWTQVRAATWRWIAISALACWVLLIGYSRVYFHVHYASDVLAGWTAGFLFLFTSLLILHKLEPEYAAEAAAIIEEFPPDPPALPDNRGGE